MITTHVEHQSQCTAKQKPIFPIRHKVQQGFYSGGVIAEVTAESAEEVRSQATPTLFVGLECCVRLSLHIRNLKGLPKPEAMEYWTL